VLERRSPWRTRQQDKRWKWHRSRMSVWRTAVWCCFARYSYLYHMMLFSNEYDIITESVLQKVFFLTVTAPSTHLNFHQIFGAAIWFQSPPTTVTATWNVQRLFMFMTAKGLVLKTPAFNTLKIHHLFTWSLQKLQSKRI